MNKRSVQDKGISKYFKPGIISLVLFSLIFTGGFYVKEFFLGQVAQERSFQLKEMSKQIRTNLNHNIDANWIYLAAIKSSIKDDIYYNAAEARQAIRRLEKHFFTAELDCRLLLLDDMGVGYTSTGDIGIWNDIRFLADGADRHTFVSETRNIKGNYMAFVEKLEGAITNDTGLKLTHIVLLKDIKSMKKYYTTESYGGHAATYIINEKGNKAYLDTSHGDILGVRNIRKALREGVYAEKDGFNKMLTALDKDGISSANILIDDKEYSYCIARMKGYDISVMLLLPSEYVAVSTMKMLESSIEVMAVFTVILLGMAFLAMVSFLKERRSNQMYKLEQETNQRLDKLRMAAEDALQVAESANKAKSTFLSNMSHDIRTPMNAIIGFTTLAISSIHDGAKVEDYLNKILSASKHLLSLINDVLDMSRIESGKVVIEEEAIDFKQMLQELYSIVAEQAEAKGLELSMDTKGLDYTAVYCDETRMKQVVLNLISNAIKFTPYGGKVFVGAKNLGAISEGKAVFELRVKDNGIGMSEEFAQHVFEPFEREQSSTVSKIQGTGLGMAIAKNIIEMMGGTIEVKTKKGAGTEFILQFKLRLQSKAETEASEAKSELLPKEQDFTGKRLLLVEDNELNKEIACELLGSYGFELETAENGQEAVDMVAASAPGYYDLVLMDVQMPIMDGHEATRHIRALENAELAQIPIVAMTANAFEEDRQASKECGMNGFISKPINMQEVLKALEENLQK